MKLSLLLVLILITACNSKSSKNADSTVGDKVDSNVYARQVANTFMKSAGSEIDPALKITSNDLEQWRAEGLITESELKQLLENL